MKVGDYVRTPYGIRKVKEIIVKDNYLDDGFYVEDRFIVCGHKAMQEVQSSPNIIDLIEVGDYVNGEYVTYINKKDSYVDVGYDDAILRLKGIKSIVTKEQFSQMEYKIEEE